MSKVDMFLAIDGSRQGAISGESVAAGHEGEMEIKSWSWGMSQQVHSASQIASKASVRALNIRKPVDSGSTAIMSAIRTAEILSKVVLVCRDSGGHCPIDSVRITLKRARVCDYEIHGSVDDGKLLEESFSIAFKEIEVVYSPHAAANLKGGACTYVDVYE